MWYKFDVYKKVNESKSRKVATHWYPNYKQAQDARRAIEKFKEGKYLLQPRENAPFKFIKLGGWTCGAIQQVSKLC